MISTSPITDPKTGKASGLKGVIIDLTELKTKDAELHQSEESYHGLFNTVKDALGILDTEGTFIDVNKGAEEMFCYPREFFIGKTFETLSAPGRNDLAHIFGQVRDAFHGMPQQFEFWGLRNGSEEFLTEVRLYKGTYFGKDAVIFLSVDITGRKNVEMPSGRARSCSGHSSIMQTTPFSSTRCCQAQKPGRYIMVNNIACTRLGYTREELLSMSPYDIVSPSHIRKMPAIAQMVRNRGHATFDAIHLRKDGTEFPVEISTHTFELRGRQLSLSIARDVTERKRMEEAIRSSEETLHAIIDGSSIPMFVINRDHEVLYWNKALEKYSGVPSRDVRGTSGAWRAFYTEKRPVLADLLIDNEIEMIRSRYDGKFTYSPYIEGFEATDFFPKIGTVLLGLPVFFQDLKVPRYGIFNHFQGLLDGVPLGGAAGKFRAFGPVAAILRVRMEKGRVLLALDGDGVLPFLLQVHDISAYPLDEGAQSDREDKLSPLQRVNDLFVVPGDHKDGVPVGQEPELDRGFSSPAYSF